MPAAVGCGSWIPGIEVVNYAALALLATSILFSTRSDNSKWPWTLLVPIRSLMWICLLEELAPHRPSTPFTPLLMVVQL